MDIYIYIYIYFASSARAGWAAKDGRVLATVEDWMPDIKTSNLVPHEDAMERSC